MEQIDFIFDTKTLAKQLKLQEKNENGFFDCFKKREIEMIDGELEIRIDGKNVVNLSKIDESCIRVVSYENLRLSDVYVIKNDFLIRL